MKRLLLGLGTLSLTTVIPAAPVGAQAPFPPDFGVIEFCKNDVPINHPDLKLGNCIASRTTNGWTYQGWAQHVCFFYEGEEPDYFYSFYDGYVDCVHDKADAFIG